MLTRLQAFQNIGKFDTASSNVQLPRLLEIYAENGRGKSTLAAIFRSLATGDTVVIAERHRLTALNAPRIVIEVAGGPPHATFDNGAWNQTLPQMAVFDDTERINAIPEAAASTVATNDAVPIDQLRAELGRILHGMMP